MMPNADSSQIPQSRRRWFSFSLRSLLVLTLIVAALFAWFGKYIIRSRIERSVVAKIQAAGGRVYYDYQLGFGGFDKSPTPTGSRLTRYLLGNDIYATVIHVSFNRPTTDEQVQALGKLENLTDLAIFGPEVTDKSVDDLLSLSKLRSLSMSSTLITPAGLARFSNLKRLQSLTLYGDTITDEHLHELLSFPSLQYLQIIRSPISDAGVKQLRSIKGLRSLDMFATMAVTDEGIKPLATLADLEQLRLFHVAITDDSLTAISKMEKLVDLCLRHLPITDEGFGHLKSLHNLETLQLSGTLITDDSLKVISQFPHLRNLYIGGTKVTDEGVVALKRMMPNCSVNP